MGGHVTRLRAHSGAGFAGFPLRAGPHDAGSPLVCEPMARKQQAIHPGAGAGTSGAGMVEAKSRSDAAFCLSVAPKDGSVAPARGMRAALYGIDDEKSGTGAVTNGNGAGGSGNGGTASGSDAGCNGNLAALQGSDDEKTGNDGASSGSVGRFLDTACQGSPMRRCRS